ncbi:MAG: hypothetical protein ACKVQS_00890 [Fimbriimonadaceae bacterium]
MQSELAKVVSENDLAWADGTILTNALVHVKSFVVSFICFLFDQSGADKSRICMEFEVRGSGVCVI